MLWDWWYRWRLELLLLLAKTGHLRLEAVHAEAGVEAGLLWLDAVGLLEAVGLEAICLRLLETIRLEPVELEPIRLEAIRLLAKLLRLLLISIDIDWRRIESSPLRLQSWW